MLLYLFLIVFLLMAVCGVGLFLMIKKYYWGPTGRPPQYRHYGDELKKRADDTRRQ